MQPVLIVGAGPVGQIAALMLSRQGISSVLIDRRSSTLMAPKAHAVNPRTLEICESLGVSADRIRALGASANDAGMVYFVATLTGIEFGALPYERQGLETLADTPYPLTNIPQPLFEAELTAAIAGDANVTFHRGIQCDDLQESADRVNATLRNLASGAVSEQSFDYVIAADGAGSRTRQRLGITMAGPEVLQNYLMIHFTADLSHLTEARKGLLYFLFEPGVNGVLIAYDRAHTWVLMHPLKGADKDVTSYDDAQYQALIEQAVGCPVSATVENVTPWSMSAQVAEQYRAGRVFLAGDAAHRFPPAGGLGLNTGIVDAQNLTWKLAAVLKGKAGAGLLDTYEQERQPVARTNSTQSLANSARLADLRLALMGSDRALAAQHYAAVAAAPADFPALARAVEAQRPHFDSFNLQLGYRYNSSAIHNPSPVPTAPDVSRYEPSWQVGAHFPHRQVRVAGKEMALLHCLPVDRFSLLCGPEAEVSNDLEDCSVFTFGQDFEDQQDWQSLTGLPDSGALLIRPDGHIAARFDDTRAGFGAVISTVFEQLLAKGA